MQNSRILLIVLLCCALVLAVFTTLAQNPPGDGEIALLATADTEGHINPCQTCPTHAGLGGMARRATLLADARKQGPVLLLDAGNGLFGSESASSEGQVLAEAFARLQYDAVNLSYRDFRLGKDHTRKLLAAAKLQAVSANILDSATNEPLVEPFVIKQVGRRKIAVIGLSQVPPNLAALPRLAKQLDGIHIVPPGPALKAAFATVKPKSDLVVLLYNGSAESFNALRPEIPAELAVVVVGGLGQDELPAGDAAGPIVLTPLEHGKSVERVTVPADPAIAKLPAGSTLFVDSSLSPDPQMEQWLQQYQAKPLVIASSAESPATAPVAAVVPINPPPSIPPTSTTQPDMTVVTAKPPPEHATTLPGADSAPRVAARQPLEPRGLAGVNLTHEQVNAAIDRGRDFLWAELRERQKRQLSNTIVGDEQDLLAVLALLHAGAVEKIPEFDSELRKYLDQTDPRKKQLAIYEAGLYCMLIEGFGDPSYLPKLRDTARCLVELQGPGGSWNYGLPFSDTTFFGPPPGKADHSLAVFGGTPLDGNKPVEERLARKTPWVKDTDGDNSTSQFALLGIRSAARWHLTAAPEVWSRNLAITRDRQCADGGWDYKKDGAYGYGSMTCAGICAMAIDRFQLGEKDPAADEQIERGLGWLDQHFSVTSNPLHGTGYLYYYLYSLERLGRILNTEFIGEHEWYPLGARFLVDAQKPNGKWVESFDTEDPREPTSFALLFLTRATATLNNDLPRNGSGELRTALTTAPPARLYVILDASGSMLDQMDGRPKFDIARDATSAMLGMLPSGAQAALRVYGHRLRSLEAGSDEDTELKIPLGPYDAEKYAPVLKALRPKGKTPLSLSLTQAMQDLGDSPEPTTLVLLTDGGEDTVPRRDPVKVAAALAKIPAITFHIIGVDIKQDDWNAQLRAMAEASGGKYWPAPKASELNRALRAALLGDPEYFRVVDSAGKEVFHGKFGQATRLLEGQYELLTPFAGREFHQSFWINTKGTTVVTFDASGSAHDATARNIGGGSTPPPPVPANPAPRFCTHCGKPLVPGAKFCTHCGTKVSSDLR